MGTFETLYGGTQRKSEYTYEYDGFGAVTKISQDGAEVRRYTYYRDSAYTSSSESTFNYNAMGQVRKGGTSQSDREIDWEKEIYDAEGRLVCVKSYMTDGNGVRKGSETEKLRVTYDNYGRIYKITDYSTGTASVHTYSYDAKGEMTKESVSGYTSGYVEGERDAYGRVYKIKISGQTGTEQTYEYEYKEFGGAEPDDRLEAIELPQGKEVMYTYDLLGRLSDRRLRDGREEVIRETYSYQRGANNDRTTEYVSNILYQGNGYSTNIEYTYDKGGNIQSVTEGGKSISYEYDQYGRLSRENNQELNFTKTYSYTPSGNIRRINEYDYTTGAVSSGVFRKDYDYTYDGTGRMQDYLVVIMEHNSNLETTKMQMCGETFDNLGNPCKYKGSVIEWKQGRLMRTYGSKTYKYDASGIRTEKVSNGTTYKYYTIGGEIQSETRTQNGVTTKIWYYYDKSGICGIEYNGTEYYFQKDIQGDVVRIVNGAGETVARYVYDAWGNHKVLNGSGAENTSETFIGNINPIRYRGYYYDTDTGFYYLQSRYYDPEVGRFINADDITYIDPETLNGLNLYSYCSNNPVMNVDYIGDYPVSIWENIVGFAKDIFFGFGGMALKKSSYLFAQLAEIPMFLLDDIGGAVFNPTFLSTMKLATRLQYNGKILNGLGKIAQGVGYTLLALDIGLTIYSNFMNSNLSFSRKITDTIIDIGFTIGGAAISMAVGALVGSIGGPVGTILGVIAGGIINIGIWAFQTFAVDLYNSIKVGFHKLITQIIPNAWNNFVNGWKYFWSFAWI